MAKSVLTDLNKKYIEKNYLKLSSRLLAIEIGCSRSAVLRFMKINNLVVPKKVVENWRVNAMRGRTTVTAEQEKFIVDNYLTMPVKTIGQNIGKSFTCVMKRLEQLGLEIPKEIREQRKRDGMYRKGSVPANKGKKQCEYMSAEAIEKTKATRFKKGDIPKNAFKEDGVITIRHDHKNRGGKKYKYIRISLGKWMPLHKHLWEEKFGPVPNGHCLWFIDGNTMNCTLDNIELITRAENVKRNTIWEYPAEVQENIKLLNKIKKQIRKHE